VDTVQLPAGHRQVARLFGAADALVEATGPIEAADRADYDRIVAAAHDSLGEVRAVALQVEGRAMTLEEAVAYALDEERA